MPNLPEWLDVRSVATVPASLADLDTGEREAIQLAEQEHPDLLLIDEKRGRVAAEKRGIITTGTLGVLISAACRGFLDGHEAFRRLTGETNFRSTPEVQRAFLARMQQISKRGS